MSCSIPITLRWLQCCRKSLQRLFNGAQLHTHTIAHWRERVAGYCWRKENSERLHQSCHQKSTCLLVCVSVLVCGVFMGLVVPVCVCVWLDSLCVCVCLEMRFTFWSERGFTGLWVDRSMLSGRHTLSRARIALERPQQSVLAKPVP